MKVLWRKLNKSKLSIRLVYMFTLIIFLFSYIFLFRSLLLLNNIETKIRIFIICILGILLIIYSFFDLLLLLTKKHKSVIATSFIIIVISGVSIIGSLAINRIYVILNSLNKDTVLYTTNLITLNSTTFTNDENFKVGIINNESDIEGNVLAYELIDKKNLNISVVKYDSYFELLENLYNKTINGMFVSSNYEITYEIYDAYANIHNDVRVVYDYSKEMKNQDTIESSGSVDKPFTILLMGVDSKYDGLKTNAAFNGDTLMLISFNPHTLSATVFSIPRDTYVPISCLKNNQSSKINSSASYGTKCVIDTVENLTDIKIDYYVKINFKGVVNLVDSLGGIDVTVPDGINFCEQDSNRDFSANALQCIKSGYQHMDGEKALAFARHRKTLPAGDFQRVQHQQLVVDGIANSIKNLKNINDFTRILESVSNNIDTNMATSQMMNLYNVGKSAILGANNGSMINVQKTYLTGYDLTMYVENLRANVYTFQYYEQSLEEIKDALKVTLEQKDPTITKTFNFSINDNYEVPVIGKKYYTVERNEVIPSFTGKTNNYVKSWCEGRKITVHETFIDEESSGFNPELEDGTVIGQSVTKGRLVKDVHEITINVIKRNKTTSTTTPDDNNAPSEGDDTSPTKPNADEPETNEDNPKTE